MSPAQQLVRAIQEIERGEEVRVRLSQEKVTWRELEGETILLDLQESRYLRLNRPGSVLLPGLVAGEDQDQLVARLRQVFDVDESRAAEDVQDLLRQLAAAGLLEDD